MKMLRFALCILPILCLLLASCAEDVPDPISAEHLLSAVDSQGNGNMEIEITNVDTIIPIIPIDDPISSGDSIVIEDSGIVITIGAGARPMISISDPIYAFWISDDDWTFEWGFDFLDDDDMPVGEGLADPFKYGVLPPNPLFVYGRPDPPDLVEGKAYFIEVLAIKGMAPFFAEFTFVR